MGQAEEQSWLNGRKKWAMPGILTAIITVGFLCHSSSPVEPKKKPASGYLGSSQCRTCHERFYQLWAPSYHGLAMQPYTETFAKANLKPQLDEIVIGKVRYRAVIDKGRGFVVESDSSKQKKHPILHVLGGKNVYYFLTMLERGHLQTLPVAYDVNKQQWFDTAASGVRHFPDRTDEAIHWTDREYTFNTACYGCHVSQLVKNYDAKTDAYNTQWNEPGINCETCHGPADEHARVCREAGEGNVPKDLKLNTITQSRGFTGHQVDSACSTCHAKGMPITNEFIPGESFFQHSDLITLEHPDFYPDGRDLGENYTFTTWRMSPCAQSGKLDCVVCHTSSGRFRFKDAPNDACISCHSEKAKNFQAHTHHETSDVTCIQCHMPMTDFARMNRSDHSMRPPMPAATIQFQSPNACNICHQDEGAKWADDAVRQWHQKDYQKTTLETAALVDQARKDNWKNLSEILTYLQQKDREEVFANSLIRLLRNNDDPRIAVVLADLIKNDPSPLIRGSAADVLGYRLGEKTISALAKATGDSCRLVRIRAAASLSVVPDRMIPADFKDAVKKASQEYVSSLASRPDDAMSRYNLGNFHMDKGKLKQAVEAYEMAINLRNDLILPYVNASLAYNRLGDNNSAAEQLRQALAIEPNSIAAHLNLALLYGEMDQRDKAIKEFQRTFKLDSESAVSAYNLCVLLAETKPQESIVWGRRTIRLQPDNARYAYTLAFYLHRAEQSGEVVSLLQPFVDRHTTEINIYILLAGVYEQLGNRPAAIKVYETATENKKLSEQIRYSFRMRIQQLMPQ